VSEPKRAAVWTDADIPDLTGQVALVTGSNSGLGLSIARHLAEHGARVLLACRNTTKAEAAADEIRGRVPAAEVETVPLDLASLADVRRAAAALRAAHPRLDVLLNNAGVMALPYRQTADGFEMQFGTNHLGHFALTGLLLEPLLATPGARVVTVSSGFHRLGAIRFDDPNWQRGYRRWPAYGQSKLANLLFAYELQRRLDAAGAGLLSVAAHPGYAATNLQATGPRMQGSSLLERLTDASNALFAQSAAMGALPQLYAAAAPDVRGGEYYGPDGVGEMWGHPTRVESNARSRDRDAAARLWALSERLTGVTYDALARGA
jgi:NAD(P)-dependent dehydrogenase (short-subunit alcohol dehydrogenase family)